MKRYNGLFVKTYRDFKNKRLIHSFKYAFSGIGSAFLSEANMRIHVLVMILVVLFGVFLKISTLEWIICIALFGLVISAELFNTAIEYVVDIASPEKQEKARLAKDIAAGAVLITAIAAAIIGLIIFLPKIINLFNN